MVSLGTGYFNPESSSTQGGTIPGGAIKAVRHFPIFKHTSPRPPSSVVSSSAGSEADDEATTTVSGPSSSSSSSDPSSKRIGPPVAMVSGRNKRMCTESSIGFSGGETSSLSTNTAPSIIDEEREHFPLFTDEEDCTSIGDSRAGESSSSTNRSSPIPWSSINLTHVPSNSSTSVFSAYHNRHYPSSHDKEAPLLPSYRSASSASQAERGRQLARVLLDQARTKQPSKKRRVSFARPVRLASDAGSSASTSTSSSMGDKGDHDALDPFRPSSRHVLSKRNKVRASLLRRAVQSLRRRKDFMDNLFEIPTDGQDEKRDDDCCSTTADSSTYYPTISAVTARNLAFAEWERYLSVPKMSQSTTWSQQPQSWNNLPKSPPRTSKNSTPQPSPSRISVTSSTTSFFDAVSSLPSSSVNDRLYSDSTERPDPNTWLLYGLSARTDRDSMLDQLGFLPRETMTNHNDPSKLSREAALKTLDTLGMVWDKEEDEELPKPFLPLPSVPPRSPPRHVQKDFGKKPTISILGVVVVNYPQMVRDQVNHFRRNVLNVSDAIYGMWGATTPATT